MEKERLLKLAEVLEDVKPDFFDEAAWIEHDIFACTMRWAAQHPWFRARGCCVGKDDAPYFNGVAAEAAAKDFFDITELQIYYLFMSSLGGRPNVRHVIKRIRRFVETDGKIDWPETQNPVFRQTS